MSEVKRYASFGGMMAPIRRDAQPPFPCYVPESDYATLSTERDQLRARVEELEKALNWHEKHSCSVCLGEPLRSGKRCVCRGVGTASGEAQGFREEMHALRASIAALADEWEACALANEQCSYPDEARIKAYRYCATELRQLGEGNSAAAQEGL